MNMNRVIIWFSCGAASAVAAKLTLAKYPDARVVYTRVKNEHPDNKRFLLDCQAWFGKEITVLVNDKYDGDIYQVFEKERYLVGPSGAKCTTVLKKDVRKKFQLPGDMQVFGYTVEEQDRADRFIDANNDVKLWTPLIDANLTKADCLTIIDRAGIKLPAMYELGYKNNNCIGCVKGGAGYWNKIRVDFPETFERMSQVEQTLGRAILSISVSGKRTRVQLKDLPAHVGRYEAEPDIECGIYCHMAEQTIQIQTCEA